MKNAWVRSKRCPDPFRVAITTASFCRTQNHLSLIHTVFLDQEARLNAANCAILCVWPVMHSSEAWLFRRENIRWLSEFEQLGLLGITRSWWQNFGVTAGAKGRILGPKFQSLEKLPHLNRLRWLTYVLPMLDDRFFGISCSPRPALVGK